MATGGTQDREELIAHQTDDITILLVGQTGHGKSATGNSLLGKNAFVSKRSPGSVTEKIQRAVALRKGRRIEIVDSPGFADTSNGTEFVQENLLQAVYQTLPGFNAIVFVLSPDRFTDELVKTVNLFFEFFGDDVGQFAFILFTHTKSKEIMNEYIDSTGENPTGNVRVLLDLLERCGRKVMYMDNNKNKEKKQVMVDEIIRTIDANKVLIGQEYFTNDMFKEAIYFVDNYFEENNPTQPLKGNNENDMVEMASDYVEDVEDMRVIVRKYDKFKYKIIKDKSLFEIACAAFKRWFIISFPLLAQLFLFTVSYVNKGKK